MREAGNGDVDLADSDVLWAVVCLPILLAPGFFLGPGLKTRAAQSDYVGLSSEVIRISESCCCLTCQS